jgi:hypothetical protein
METLFEDEERVEGGKGSRDVKIVHTLLGMVQFFLY